MFVRFVLLAFACVTLTPTLGAQTTFLGALEDVPGVYTDEPNSYAVRVLFEKDGGEWKALPSDCPDQSCLRTISSSYPREVIWTVTFDGRNLGRITGKTPKEFKFYSHVGLQEITSSGSVPVVGKRSPHYGGFTDQSVYRPLVTNSQPYFQDPELWSPAQLRAELIEILKKKFRQTFPKLCKASDADETKLISYAYDDEDIKSVKAYVSKRGWTVAQLHLEGAIDCGAAETGFGLDDPWFVADSHGTAAYLDQGMWLVDAGDYANDGKSELLFSIDRYNRGGYELFYDEFKKKAKFEFSYH
jgi:hypothetical protein